MTKILTGTVIFSLSTAYFVFTQTKFELSIIGSFIGAAFLIVGSIEIILQTNKNSKNGNTFNKKN